MQSTPSANTSPILGTRICGKVCAATNPGTWRLLLALCLRPRTGSLPSGDRPVDDQGISKILEALAKHRAREAWEEFLRVYAGTILSVVRHFEREEDAVSDCFVYVC